MFSNNVCTFMGYVGKDKVMSVVNNTNKAIFSIAVSGTKDETLWVNCEAWGKLADLEVKKGDLVSVVGSLKESSYEKDGKKITRTYLRIEGLRSFDKVGNAPKGEYTKPQSTGNNQDNSKPSTQQPSYKPTNNNSNTSMSYMDNYEDDIPPF